MSNNSDTDKVSSPLATGGAGTFFEQHVDAYWLALLLTRAIPPILHDCVIVEVSFQNEQLGWNTDDFLVIGENGAGTRRKLLGQVKRSFTVSASDDECKKTIIDYWRDFKTNTHFIATLDRFALVILRGTNRLLEHFGSLLDCARASRDGGEFARRLSTAGLLSKTAIGYADEIRAIVSEQEGKSVSAEELWAFLCALQILSFDLNTATRQTEAMVKSLLAHATSEPDAQGVADATWNALLRECGEAMPQAQTYRRENLPEAIRLRHRELGGNDQHALRALEQHSQFIVSGIRSTIGVGLHLKRAVSVQEVTDKLESAKVVLVSGPAGSGKSGIAKDVCELFLADHFVFSFRSEEFAAPHLDESLQRSRIPVNAATLGAILGGQSKKILLVESIERLLEKSTRDAFTDLLTLVAKDPTWRLILTCRDYSTELVRACFLGPVLASHKVAAVPLLTDDELAQVENAYPNLRRPLGSPVLRELLRNPYVLDKSLQLTWSDEKPLPQNEWEFRGLFWREIIRREEHAASAMPRRREEAFVEIALRRARSLATHAPIADLDREAVGALVSDSLVVASEASKLLLAPAHDVLEDWAILEWLGELFHVHRQSVAEFANAIGTYPAIRRTYRRWVAELLERDPQSADSLFQSVIREIDIAAHFRDDTLISLLRSHSSPGFLERNREELFANDKALLRRVIYLLRVACVKSPSWLTGNAASAWLFMVPDGPAWEPTLAARCKGPF